MKVMWPRPQGLVSAFWKDNIEKLEQEGLEDAYEALLLFAAILVLI